MMEHEIETLSTEHFRLKSSRRKEREKHGQREKLLMRLYREYDALRSEQRDLGWERLDPPVQRGWKRYFVLRPEVARSRDAAFFQGILDRINTMEYSSRPDFKKKVRRGGKKMFEVRSQELQKLWTSCFKKKKFTELEASYFEIVMTDEKPGSYYRWTYVFREPWRFKLKIEPNIIRWTRVKDFNLERRLNELNRYIESNHLWPRIHKLVNGRYQYWGRYVWCGDLEKYRYDPLKNRTFAEVLEEYWPEERAGIVIGKPSDDRGFFFFGWVWRAGWKGSKGGKGAKTVDREGARSLWFARTFFREKADFGIDALIVVGVRVYDVALLSITIASFTLPRHLNIEGSRNF